MIFRKATVLDTQAVTAIYEYAKKILRDSGIPQWQGPVPGKDSFLQDLALQQAYVVEENGVVIATIQIIDHEPYYDRVENGSWKDTCALVAHHVAVSDGCRKHGVAGFMLQNAELIAKERKKTSLRLDTHELNHRMRHLLEKHGFENIGVVKMPNGEPRLAYEKTFDTSTT